MSYDFTTEFNPDEDQAQAAALHSFNQIAQPVTVGLSVTRAVVGSQRTAAVSLNLKGFPFDSELRAVFLLSEMESASITLKKGKRITSGGADFTIEEIASDNLFVHCGLDKCDQGTYSPAAPVFGRGLTAAISRLTATKGTVFYIGVNRFTGHFNWNNDPKYDLDLKGYKKLNTAKIVAPRAQFDTAGVIPRKGNRIVNQHGTWTISAIEPDWLNFQIDLEKYV